MGAQHPLLGLLGTDGRPNDLFTTGRKSNMQDRFYNGWTHDHHVTSVFHFCLDGTISTACFNVPGSVHDIQVAECGNMYENLERVYNTTGRKQCCVDLAFGQVNWDYLYKSCQDIYGLSAQTLWERIEELSRKRQATLAQQTAEWGCGQCKHHFHG
jgi:hypothetical protein